MSRPDIVRKNQQAYLGFIWNSFRNYVGFVCMSIWPWKSRPVNSGQDLEFIQDLFAFHLDFRRSNAKDLGPAIRDLFGIRFGFL